METTTLKFKKAMLPTVTQRETKPRMSVKFTPEEIKNSTLRMKALKLKREGYLLHVLAKGRVNEIIVECIKNSAF